MKKILLFLFTISILLLFFQDKNFADTDTIENDLTLKSKYAVVIDADSKRVLYGKNENEQVPMASTTKIMTCIIALDFGFPDLLCTTSRYASSMPDVQLNASKGEKFYLKDILYSLMLRSHNDSAVIIAENTALYYIYNVKNEIYHDKYNILQDKDISFITDNFYSTEYDSSIIENFTDNESKTLVNVYTDIMNEKAKELGCKNTNFITPNGLDAENETGIHSTTAKELALIMSYCITNDNFLRIVQTKSYDVLSYKSINGTLKNNSSYSVSNANAFLNMYDNIIAGKTGFTGNAGYCYTCAYNNDGRTFVVALLACGWPPEKTAKWKDARTLLNYARENFYYKNIISQNFPLKNVKVKNSFTESIDLKINETYNALLSKNDNVKITVNIPDILYAPIVQNTQVGTLNIFINDEPVKEIPIYTATSIDEPGIYYKFLSFLGKYMIYIEPYL